MRREKEAVSKQLEGLLVSLQRHEQVSDSTVVMVLPIVALFPSVASSYGVFVPPVYPTLPPKTPFQSLPE